MELFHCFGATPTHAVDTDTAVEMLRVSRCRYLAVNTHNIGEVDDGGDLPVGYGSATMASVLGAIGGDVEPILNINHPTSAGEAIERSLRAHELTGISKLKLEVLDLDLRVANNAEVLKAAEELAERGLEIWPLLRPIARDALRAVESEYPVVRLMGSPIGSRAGIGAEAREVVAKVGSRRGTTDLMLDGGVGTVDDVRAAATFGFDAVLVNSLLFTDARGPVAALADVRSAIDAANARA